MNKRTCQLASDFANPPRLGVMSQAGEVEAAFYDADDRRLYMAGVTMLAALRLAKPVCADAYYDALAVQENPTGDALNHPAENAQSTAAALAAWEAVNAAIALAEGRAPDPLDLPESDTPHAADAPKVEPAPVDFEQRRDGWLVAFVPISSAARQWSIEASPKGARWEHERWYAKRDRAPAVRHAIESEGFTVREG